MSIETFRERVNLKIFSSKETVLLLFRIQSSLVATLAIGLLIYIIGFPQNDEIRHIEIFFMKFLFGFYILNYLVRFLYTFEPGKFLRSTWLELALVILLFVEAVSTIVFNAPLVRIILNAMGYGAYLNIYHIVLQVFLLIFLVIDLAKVSTLFDLVKLDASTMFILSFLMLIGVGTIMLMLPEMSIDHKGADWMTALFTSASASCVTGLTVVDTGTFFTFKGQFVIMVLFQLGGLNIISFATFFASMYTKGVGIKHQSLMQDFFSSGSLFDAHSLLRKIILVTIIIEGAGTIAIYSLWNPEIHFSSVSQKLFYSVFHSISAFNNAGFSLFSNGLYETLNNQSYILHVAFIILIFLGSLGFSAITDIFGISSMRQRMKLPWKKLQLSSMVALYSSLILAVFGAAVFCFTEYSNELAGKNTFESLITSVFQSVAARTAGFNTVDIGALELPTHLLLIFLMFVGGSSGSTGGGIKTSTFTIILISVYSTIRGKRNLEIWKHNIAWELLNKAFSIFIFSASFVFVATFILTILEPQTEFIKILFEVTSAFATTGLSTGITPYLGDSSKMMLIISMFVGRVGTMTLALALSRKVISVSYKYPNAHFMVG